VRPEPSDSNDWKQRATILGLVRRAPPAENIYKKHNNRDDQKGMNQAAADMYGKTQKP
jgi:hypothetical protein